jgi:hypothetical protein
MAKKQEKQKAEKQEKPEIAQNPNVKAIKGYRQLSQEELGLINEAKELGCNIDDMIRKLEKLSNREDGESAPDKRWLAIAKTDLQKGMMSLTRAVAKPDFF